MGILKPYQENQAYELFEGKKSDQGPPSPRSHKRRAPNTSLEQDSLTHL
jgi:hypothetical protein